jgi:predicted porin
MRQAWVLFAISRKKIKYLEISLNRVTNVAVDERQFDTWTLGAQYFVNRKTRVIFNYEIRNAEAPNLPDNAVPNQILDGIDNRFAVQVLAVF